MEYSVGSLADLITGSNTPNKPKVVQKKFIKIEPTDTHQTFKSVKKETRNSKDIYLKIEDLPKNKKTKLEKINKKNNKKMKRKIEDSSLSNLLDTESKLKKKTKTIENITGHPPKNEKPRLEKSDKEEGKKIKRKIEDSSSSNVADVENEPSPKKVKLNTSKSNAERRIKNKEIKKNHTDEGLSKTDAEGRIKNKETKKSHTDIKELERTIFIGNIPIEIKKKKVKQYFKKYGTIESIRIRGISVANPNMSKKVAAIKKEFNPNRKNVNGYIRFADKEDALRAAVENGVLFEGHHLRVHVCSSKERPDETKAIFVGNLSFNAKEDELWKLFETCGSISHVRIIRDSKTGMGKGFGYVNFTDSDAVQLALEMEHVKIGDRELRISPSNLKVAKKRKNRNKMISQAGKPTRAEKGNEFKENNTSTKNQSKDLNKNFQGTKFGDKRKKRKVNKGILQKKIMIKKIAPKVKGDM